MSDGGCVTLNFEYIFLLTFYSVTYAGRDSCRVADRFQNYEE